MSPAVLGGENSGNALEPSNALNCAVWRIPAVLSRGIPGKALRAFPEFSRISSGKSQPVLGLWPNCQRPRVCKRCFPNGGSSLVRREQLPAPHFNLNVTSINSVLPSCCLFSTFLVKLFLNPCSAGYFEPRFGNRALQRRKMPEIIRSHDVFLAFKTSTLGIT